MRDRFGVMVACVIVLFVVGCAGKEEPQISVETAFDEMWDVLDGIKTPEDRVPILETFIAKYPDSSQSVNALGDVIYYRVEKMNDLPGAVAAARLTLAQTTDPELRFEIGIRLHELSSRAGEPTDLASVADELAAHRTLGFVDHLDVVEAAERSQSWETMLEHAVAMEAFANAAAFRAAYPDDDFTDERVEFSVNRRQAWVLAYQGGALINLGRVGKAQTVFSRAEDLPPSTDFLGIPETPIDTYRGQAALLLGESERATELFAHSAIMGGDHEAMEGFKFAFTEIHGSEDGFDDFVAATRQRIARPLADFTLADYGGSLVGVGPATGKVLVISFWNPG